MTYRFQSQIGGFTIEPEGNDPHRVELFVDGECLGSYDNAAMAADRVHNHKTGFSLWDTDVHLPSPANILEWDHLKL